jgi:hypothetical protein
MIDYYDCGARVQVEYRHDGADLVRVYCYDDKPVTECPVCGAPLPTEVLQPEPDLDNLRSPALAYIPDGDDPCASASS